MPQRWFGPKSIGYGISPKGWAGWLFLTIHAAVTIALIKWGVPALSTRLHVAPGVLYGLTLLISLGVLTTVIARTYRTRP